MSASPLDFWISAWTSGLRMAETGVKLGETVRASGTVIDSRSRSIADAVCDPLNGDYDELGMMMPEKVVAFGQAAASGWRDVGAVQSDIIANGMDMLTFAMAGRLPSASEAGRMTARSLRAMERVASSGGRALAPVHRAATDNARRLGRAKPR